MFFKNILIVKIYIENINKNIFNNFLIAESRNTHIHLFQNLPSPALAPAPAPESWNAPVLHRLQERSGSASFDLWVTHGCAHEFCGLLEFWWVSILIGGIDTFNLQPSTSGLCLNMNYIICKINADNILAKVVCCSLIDSFWSLCVLKTYW